MTLRASQALHSFTFTPSHQVAQDHNTLDFACVSVEDSLRVNAPLDVNPHSNKTICLPATASKLVPKNGNTQSAAGASCLSR